MTSPFTKMSVLPSILALLAFATACQSIAAQTSPAPKLTEQQFKNIQVLKGLPSDELFAAMQFITASLGVDCEHCHVREGREMKFDKDDKKPKVTARKMIQMMFAVNKDNFEGKREVTCYSCHRSEEHTSELQSPCNLVCRL